MCCLAKNSMRSRSPACSPARRRCFWLIGNDTSPGAHLLIGLQRALAALAVIDDRPRIGLAQGDARAGEFKRLSFPRLVDQVFRQLRQFRHPAPDVAAVRIELLTLKGGIENAEI